MNLRSLNLLSRLMAAAGGEGGAGGAPNPAPPPPPPAPPAFTYGDAHKDYVTGKGWKSTDDIITSYKNLEALNGAFKEGRGVAWPKDEADAEGWKAIRSRLGVPDSADAYELPLYPGATEPDAFQKALVVELHKNGVPKAAAQALAKFVNDYDAKNLADANAAAEAKSATDLAALKAEWGTAHDANHGLAVTLMGHMGFTKDEIAAMSKDADVLRRFHKGATALGTKAVPPGDGSGTTAAQAREKLDELRAKRNKGEITAQQWDEAVARYGAIAATA